MPIIRYLEVSIRRDFGKLDKFDKFERNSLLYLGTIMRFTQNDLVRRSQNTALFWSLPTIGFSVAFTRTNTKPHPASSTLKFCCQGFFAFFVLEATAALVLTEAEADGLEKEAPSFLFMARGRRR